MQACDAFESISASQKSSFQIQDGLPDIALDEQNLYHVYKAPKIFDKKTKKIKKYIHLFTQFRQKSRSLEVLSKCFVILADMDGFMIQSPRRAICARTSLLTREIQNTGIRSMIIYALQSIMKRRGHIYIQQTNTSIITFDKVIPRYLLHITRSVTIFSFLN